MLQGLIVLVALVLGLGAGAWTRTAGLPDLTLAASQVSVLGLVWLDALKMTLVPLIAALLVTAVGNLAQSARVGALAVRSIAMFVILLLLAGAYGISVTTGLLDLWPGDPDTNARFIASAPSGETPPALSLGAWLRSLLPTNVVAAAAEAAILPLVSFSLLFGFALTRLDAQTARPVTDFFKGVAAAMLVIVNWVLLAAPIGVFGLALSLGLETGLESFATLLRYIVIVSAVTASATLLAISAGLIINRAGPLAYLKAIAPVLAVAASTQSSLASLPAMIKASETDLGVRPAIAHFVLPLAVAVFRFTSPIANLAVVFFLVDLYGLEPALWQIVMAVLVAFAVSVSSVGLPGQTSFFISVAPICATLGVPVGLLPILLAVELIPDIFRTLGNVSADMSAVSAQDRLEA